MIPDRNLTQSWALSGVSRRSALRRLVDSALAASGASVAFRGFSPVRADDAQESGLIVRSQRPLDLESPLAALDHWLTPNDQFFVRSHFGSPAVGLGSRGTLKIDGLVNHPRELSQDDLAGFEQVTVPAVLQCAGNGRGFFRPKIPGVGWERGAVGHAEWSGVRLADLLKSAGIQPGAGHVHLLGADGPPSPKTPPFFRSLPIVKALDPNTILATRMNGELLPVLHGGPIRLVVPTWTGNHWMKWLRTITVARDEAPGFYQQTGYRMPRSPVPPGAIVKPSDLVPVTVMNVKSLITWPLAGASIRPGRQEARGVAWTGAGVVSKVEFATDLEPEWRPATLVGTERVGSWRQWKAAWDATRPGPRVLRVRATDTYGNTQPETTPWNRSGYLWNGIEQVSCTVG